MGVIDAYELSPLDGAGCSGHSLLLYPSVSPSPFHRSSLLLSPGTCGVELQPGCLVCVYEMVGQEGELGRALER